MQIGYAPAEFFDEQPVTLKASWTQRMRWTKGFYQVFFSYGRDLVKGISKGRFASYDMLMTVAPGMILTLLSFFVNATYLVVGLLSHGFIATEAELDMCVGSLIMTFASMYIVFFILAVITTISERSHIHAKKKWRVVTNLFTFPLFMMTYIPITVVALFKKVEWVPTKHDTAATVADVAGGAYPPGVAKMGTCLKRAECSTFRARPNSGTNSGNLGAPDFRMPHDAASDVMRP